MHYGLVASPSREMMLVALVVGMSVVAIALTQLPVAQPVRMRSSSRNQRR